jgi:hypothetical protein
MLRLFHLRGPVPAVVAAQRVFVEAAVLADGIKCENMQHSVKASQTIFGFRLLRLELAHLILATLDTLGTNSPGGTETG